MEIFNPDTWVHKKEWYQLEVINMWDLTPSVCYKVIKGSIIRCRLNKCFMREDEKGYTTTQVRVLTEGMKNEIVRMGYTIQDI